MAPYRYLVFPPNRQPTAAEVAQLQKYAELLDNRIAYGLNKRDGALAIAFEGTKFDEVIGIEPGFEKLIGAWRGVGCRVEDHLAFIKDRHALRPEGAEPKKKPKPAAAHQAEPAAPEPSLADKHTAAREAIGMSGLSLDSALRQHEAIHRVGAAVPYALIAAGTLGVIAMGVYVGQRMLSAGGESRKDTTLRVMADPMGERLTNDSKE
ncbi:hypothetical protein Pla175_10930 [Pirellulimonas nuda]|uniref:Uncharacterized protein n=1 Tax=Pirellulimonas nuda TaxID=2528009 RepID=A0A518D8C3_9BACT|nr:hypothetical protein [Pirellulimonas nuda]QDU87727.1 hypothetical protein Pla175_10930 [Pirellulimonas nuda]